jgi:hypothetical protein
MESEMSRQDTIAVPATPNIESSIAADIGAVVEGRGIYHGPWQPKTNGMIVYAYSDTDVLKDASGEQMLLTWYAAGDELARRNEGRRYGAGTELSLRQALSKPSGATGVYQDGDLVIGPQELLNGFALNGENVGKRRNTFDLLSGSKDNALKNISKILKDASSVLGRSSWSCSEVPDVPSLVRAVSLSDGTEDWLTKNTLRLGVLPFRFFREPHAVKSVSHLVS